MILFNVREGRINVPSCLFCTNSRIEWVWLHWSEYLKAQDEFYTWLHNMKVTLEPDIELQLGLKEKQWQFSHAQVLLKDVQNRSSLLDRLLEEAISLYNRIGDASVDEDAREKMKEEYEEIKNEAEVRKIWSEGQIEEQSRCCSRCPLLVSPIFNLPPSCTDQKIPFCFDRELQMLAEII